MDIPWRGAPTGPGAPLRRARSGPDVSGLWRAPQESGYWSV